MSSQYLVKLLRTHAPYLNQIQAENLLGELVEVFGLTLREAQAHGAGQRTVAFLLQHKKLIGTQKALQEMVISAMEESRPSVAVNHKKTITPSLRNADGVMDEFYDTRRPAEGFRYPDPGTEVIALCNYGGGYGLGHIPAGSRGVVTGVRMPGTHKTHHGYVGCLMYFGTVWKLHSPDGRVIPWDCMEAFEFLYPEVS